MICRQFEPVLELQSTVIDATKFDETEAAEDEAAIEEVRMSLQIYTFSRILASLVPRAMRWIHVIVPAACMYLLSQICIVSESAVLIHVLLFNTSDKSNRKKCQKDLLQDTTTVMEQKIANKFHLNLVVIRYVHLDFFLILIWICERVKQIVFILNGPSHSHTHFWHTHPYADIYTYIYTYIHAHTSHHTHAYTHTHPRTHTHTHTHTPSPHTHARAYTHTQETVYFLNSSATALIIESTRNTERGLCLCRYKGVRVYGEWFDMWATRCMLFVFLGRYMIAMPRIFLHSVGGGGDGGGRGFGVGSMRGGIGKAKIRLPGSGVSWYMWHVLRVSHDSSIHSSKWVMTVNESCARCFLTYVIHRARVAWLMHTWQWMSHIMYVWVLYMNEYVTVNEWCHTHICIRLACIWIAHEREERARRPTNIGEEKEAKRFHCKSICSDLRKMIPKNCLVLSHMLLHWMCLDDVLCMSMSIILEKTQKSTRIFWLFQWHTKISLLVITQNIPLNSISPICALPQPLPPYLSPPTPISTPLLSTRWNILGLAIIMTQGKRTERTAILPTHLPYTNKPPHIHTGMNPLSAIRPSSIIFFVDSIWKIFFFLDCRLLCCEKGREMGG